MKKNEKGGGEGEKDEGKGLEGVERRRVRREKRGRRL